MKNNIKHIFIYHAQASDEIVLNDTIVKARNRKVPDSLTFRGLIQLSFFKDGYERAMAMGMNDALDSMHIDARTLRGNTQDLHYNLYGLRRSVTLKIR